MIFKEGQRCGIVNMGMLCSQREVCRPWRDERSLLILHDILGKKLRKNMKKIKVVIWDMGGVILRSEDKTPRKKLAEQYGLTLDEIYTLVFNSESANLATLGRINETEHWKQVGRSLKITGEVLQEFQDQFWAGDRLDQDLIDYIKSLQSSCKTALLSNAWSGAREVLTNHKPCMDAFQYSIFSCEVGLAKPDPAIYNKILGLTEVEPAGAIFVDDVQVNIDAANDVGIHGVRFFNSAQAREDVNFLLNS